MHSLSELRADANPLPDDFTPAPLSPATLAECEQTAASAETGPVVRLLRLNIDYQRAVAAEHRAQVCGDAEALAVTNFARLNAKGLIEAARLDNANDWLTGFANAADCQRAELFRLCERLFRPLWKSLQADIEALAAAVAEVSDS